MEEGGQVDPDPKIQFDQVDLVNLVNLGPGSKSTRVATRTWTPGSRLTKLTKLT